MLEKNSMMTDKEHAEFYKNIHIFYSLKEAAKYAHVDRQAIWAAIKAKQLKAEKVMVPPPNGHGRIQWIIHKIDLEDYRSNKYNREKRVVDGEKLFDISFDKWSVIHASKVLTEMLGFPFPVQRIYYLLRIGSLRASKRGGAWVLQRDSLLDLYYKEVRPNSKEAILP